MTNGMDAIVQVESVDSASRQIGFRGCLYPISEKLNLQYYKVGDMVEVKINGYGTVVFLKKQVPTGAPAQPAPQTAGFVPAAQVPYGQPPVKQASKFDPNTMLWCNSVNSAIEVLKAQWDHLTPAELQEIDMWEEVIAGAKKFYAAGTGRMTAHE
jgi:hypothetical protein